MEASTPSLIILLTNFLKHFDSEYATVDVQVAILFLHEPICKTNEKIKIILYMH